MTDEVTNALLAAIRSYIEEGKTEQRVVIEKESARGAKAADKVMTESAKRTEQVLERRIAELAGTKTRGPAVIAVLAVVFIALLAYALGWVMGRADVTVAALLGL